MFDTQGFSRPAGLAAAALVSLLATAPAARATEATLCLSQCSSSVQIIGCDGRTQGPTDKAGALSSTGPWRHVGRLDGAGAPGCTGTLIGPKHVLTAAHCVLDNNNVFRNGSIRFRLAQYGSETCRQPFGGHYAVRVFVTGAYVGNSGTEDNRALDYAIVELNNPIEDAVPMDFGYVDWATVQADTPFSIGYPGDKPTGTVWQTGSSNHFLDSPNRWLDAGDRGLMKLDTDGVGGQSGSPVYVFEGGQRILVGVLIGAPVTECQAGRLWASRLTPGTVERIQNAMLFPPNGNVFDFSLRRRDIPADQVLADEAGGGICGPTLP